MLIEVKFPIFETSNNVGVIFIAENSITRVCIRHADTRYHFVQEYIVDAFIKIVFVKSMENNADNFTKNVSQDIYKKHIDDFLVKFEEMNH
jgi:hypothetical protein